MLRYCTAVPLSTSGQRRSTCRTSSRGNMQPMANIVTVISHGSSGLLATNGSSRPGNQRCHMRATQDERTSQMIR